MLEFSDAPYRFFPAKPSAPLIRLAREVNRRLILPGRRHLVREIEIRGDLDALAEARRRGGRLLFLFNHPTHSDPQTVTEVHRRLGVDSCFMAAYDIFLRSRAQAWCMQRLGHFSIDHEGSDRKALSAAIETIREGRFALNIFPEGNVFLTNDRVAPLLDGAAFIALKAAAPLDPGGVALVPASLKFTHLDDPAPVAAARLGALAADCECEIDPGAPPVEAALAVGDRLLAAYLRSHGYAAEIAPASASLHKRLEHIAEAIVSELESALERPSAGLPLVERIRGIRSQIHQIRTGDGRSAGFPSISILADKAILAYRIAVYLNPYLTERPTADRYAETVERLSEDWLSHPLPPAGPRRAVVHLHEPLFADEFLAASGGRTRDAVAALTAAVEQRLQSGLDAINASLDTPGSRLIA